MLGTPYRGSRTISKTLMLYRMSQRSPTDWDSFMTGNSDTASKGKCALIAAACRGLEAEVYRFTRQQVIGFLHAMAKFSDTVNIPTLTQQALDLVCIDDINNTLDKLSKKLTLAAAFASINQWHLHVKECLYKGGTQMFNYISKEDKLYMNIQNDTYGLFEHSPDKHLDSQADEWEPRGNRPTPELDKQLNIILQNIIQYKKHSETLT